MTNVKGLLKKIYEYYIEKPIRNTSLAGLIALSGITLFKDNVHFVPSGTIEFNGPEQDQYVWGVFPFVKSNGESSASITSYNILGGNEVGDSSSIGSMNAYSLFWGGNKVGDRSSIGSMNAYGIAGVNKVGHSSSIGSMGGYSILIGANIVGYNTKIKDEIVSRGLISGTPSGTSVGTRIEKYKNGYTHLRKQGAQ